MWNIQQILILAKLKSPRLPRTEGQLQDRGVPVLPTSSLNIAPLIVSEQPGLYPLFADDVSGGGAP